MKKCTRCKVVKNETEFAKKSATRDGLRHWCKACVAAYGAIYLSNPINLRRHRESVLKIKFGISIEEYERLLSLQNGACAICGQKETSTQNGKVRLPAVDHDHKTGKTRGLLCTLCNVALGHFRDDHRIMERAVAYLRLWTLKNSGQT